MHIGTVTAPVVEAVPLKADRRVPPWPEHPSIKQPVAMATYLREYALRHPPRRQRQLPRPQLQRLRHVAQGHVWAAPTAVSAYGIHVRRQRTCPVEVRHDYYAAADTGGCRRRCCVRRGDVTRLLPFWLVLLDEGYLGERHAPHACVKEGVG